MRTIVVTGGATGIGFAIARRLACQGDAVVLASRNLERLEAARARLESEGASCCVTELDVGDGRVNALAPGFVPTEAAMAQLLSDQGAQQRMRDSIALGRSGEPDEIVRAAAFLLSDDASCVTGAVLTVDGGRSLGPQMHGVATGEEA
jgi:NAD(P)-dependent dehydrogenase (short-subunit alcohol dehydrogenase family)